MTCALLIEEEKEKSCRDGSSIRDEAFSSSNAEAQLEGRVGSLLLCQRMALHLFNHLRRKYYLSCLSELCN
jgi:hypothetical protein